MSDWDRQEAVQRYTWRLSRSSDPIALMRHFGTPTKVAVELARNYVPSEPPPGWNADTSAAKKKNRAFSLSREDRDKDRDRSKKEKERSRTTVSSQYGRALETAEAFRQRYPLDTEEDIGRIVMQPRRESDGSPEKTREVRDEAGGWPPKATEPPPWRSRETGLRLGEEPPLRLRDAWEEMEAARRAEEDDNARLDAFWTAPTAERQPQRDTAGNPAPGAEELPAEQEGGSGILRFLFWIFAFVVGAPVSLLLLCPGLPFVAAGVGAVMAAGATVAAEFGTLSLFSDILLLSGAGLAIFALGILLLWFGVWLGFSLCHLWLGGLVGRLGRRIYGED